MYVSPIYHSWRQQYRCETGDPMPRQAFSTQSLPASSYTLNRNIMIHNILTMPLHQGNENPTQLTKNSTKQSSKAMNSSTGDATKKGDQNNWLRSVIKGALPCVAETVVAPLQRVYTLMQCQNEIVKTGRLSSPYKGMTDCFLRTIRREGFFSLWRGNSVNVISMLGVQVLDLVAPNDPRRSIFDVPLARLCAGIMLANMCSYPLQYAQVRLINDVKSVTGVQFSLDSATKLVTTNNGAAHRQFSGALDVVLKTLKSDGFGGLYRGHTASCIKIFAFIQATRANRDHILINTKEQQSQKTSPFWTMASVCTVFGLIPVALYPIGTVSRRMMMTSGEAYKYKGVMHAFFHILTKEGVCSLYKGLTPYLIWNISKTITAALLFYSLGIPVVGNAKSRERVSHSKAN